MMAYCFGSSLSPSHSLRAAATTATLSCALKSGLWNSVQQMGSSFLELYVKFIPDLLYTLLLHLLLTHDVVVSKLEQKTVACIATHARNFGHPNHFCSFCSVSFYLF